MSRVPSGAPTSSREGGPELRGGGGCGRVVGVRDVFEGVTDEGMIMTGVDRRRVPAAFEPVVTAAVRAVHERAEQASVYLYGSVATGQAHVGTSDVDLLSIGLDTGTAEKLSRQLSERFASVCRAVEIGPAECPHFIGESDEAYGNRVFLRHYCVCLTSGHPIALDRSYRADVRAARGFNGDIGQHAERWREALTTVEDRAALGRRIARKTLLAVTGLVSVHDATWTTDRGSAALRWTVIDPSFRDGLERLSGWSESLDAASGSDITGALDGVVADVVAAFAVTIGLWQRGNAGDPSLS